jgi:CheY-like chemotaxis protein
MPSNTSSISNAIHILLADDDQDDCFFFSEALKKISVATQLTTVDNGERLLTYLSRNTKALPDVIFLDLNMPRKNGAECLREIKQNKKTQHIPVIIYSTYLHDTVADQLFKNGAHYYIRKGDLPELRKTLKFVLTLMAENKFERPTRAKFILNLLEA